MTTQIVVPALGESVTEATIAKWLKAEGEAVQMDEPLVELETDKITLEVPAAAAGVLGKIDVAEGQTVEVGAVLGAIEEGGAAAEAAPEPAPEPAAEAASEEAPADDVADEGSDAGDDAADGDGEGSNEDRS